MSTELDKQAAQTTVLIGKFLGECFKLRGLPRVVKDLESIMPTMQILIEEQFQAFATQVREQSIAEIADLVENDFGPGNQRYYLKLKDGTRVRDEDLRAFNDEVCQMGDDIAAKIRKLAAPPETTEQEER